MLFINAELHPMSTKPISNGYLSVVDGKITDLGKMSDLPEQQLSFEETIDLNGKMIFPGFIDAHTHLGMSEDGVGDEGEDINEMSDPFTPHLRAIDAIDPLDSCLSVAWKAGVTTMISSPGSANPVAGQIVAMKTHGKRVDQMAIEESFAMKFALGENPKSVYGKQDQSPMSRMAIAAIIRENLAKSKRYMEEKERSEEQGETYSELDFKYEALIPILKREKKAHFHAHRAYDIMTAIRISKEFDLDYVLIHCTEGHLIADILAEEHAKVVCGPVMGTRTKPELANQTLENCSILQKAGVEPAICSDHPEVQSEYLPLSAALVTEHGLSEEDALKGITYWAAKAIGLEHRIGSLQAGLDADLLIFSGNPLDLKVKPEMIFIDGIQVND